MQKMLRHKNSGGMEEKRKAIREKLSDADEKLSKLNSKYKYINFEQDLGKDTLRQAKSTYYPDEMRKKYRVALIK